MLVNELKKIEARKKERDRKTQDLQKLISQADQVIQIENQKSSDSKIHLNSSKEILHRIHLVIGNKIKN